MSADRTELPRSRPKASALRLRLVGAICGGLALGMLGAAYASVPLYDWFCRMTGFNGTTRVADAPPTHKLDRRITIRFDANVAPGLPWKFEPERTTMEVQIGEVVTAYYRVTNQASRAVGAQAGYNVSPLTVGGYFNKVNCFCFTEQTLAPGETRDMAVVFYVDAAIDADADQTSLDTITLSYTFYPIKGSEPKPLAARDSGAGTGRL